MRLIATKHTMAEPIDAAKRTNTRIPQIRRIRSLVMRPSFPPWLNGIILSVVLAGALFVAYRLLVPRGASHSEVIDFSKQVETIQELATVRSHYRFAVVVREESGNIIVRRLADQAEYIGMDRISTALFQDPTMIVELHGVATYGVRLDAVVASIQQTDSTVTIPIPPAEVLDVKLVAADTRVIAQIKGLFRSSEGNLLGEANKHGETFVRAYATEDSTLQSVASSRVRETLAAFIAPTGRRAIFLPITNQSR